MYFFSNNAWIVYGHMTRNFTVIFVNVIGAILQTFYMIVHIFYSDKKVICLTCRTAVLVSPFVALLLCYLMLVYF